jgi:hypothetical protein
VSIETGYTDVQYGEICTGGVINTAQLLSLSFMWAIRRYEVGGVRKEKNSKFIVLLDSVVRRDSSVVIANRYVVDGPGIESRKGEGARFFAPVQTGLRAHPASCTMGTGSFPGVNRGWGVTLTTYPYLAPRLK